MQPMVVDRETQKVSAGRGVPVSLVELMVARCDDSFDRPACSDALGGGPAISWGRLLQRAIDVADALAAAGLASGDRLAHVGPHSIDWITVDVACLLSGIVHVALHADSTQQELAEQCAWLGLRKVVASGGAARPARAGAATEISLPPWRVAAAPVDREAVQTRLAHCAAACDPGAPATIVLSSGTTGRPKGIVHGQRALVTNAVAAADVFLDEPHDVRLSWLPMSHGLARVGDLYTALVRGGCLSVVTDRLQVLEASRRAAPTVILGVPALFDRLERGVAAGRIADLAAALGGRVRVCVSGGAQLRQRTAACFAAHSVPLVEGYGLAEAGPVVALSNPRINRPGAVGLPLPGVEVRLDERAESSGQLLVRTPCRALAVIEPADDGGRETPCAADTWLETGDRAAVDTDGQLRITGRLADTIVLATGMKVPPAEIEKELAEDEAVAQVCVLGTGCPWPVAVIVPEPAVIRAALRRMGVPVFSKRAALAHPRVIAWLARRLARRQQHLPRGWRVRRAVLIGRPFDAAHGEATASLKLKRPTIADHFAWVTATVQHSLETGREPPPWLAIVPSGSDRMPTPVSGGRPRPWLPSLLWRGGGDDGIARAAARSIEPTREAVAAVLEQAEYAIARLREAGTLYDPLPATDQRRPPIGDAPSLPTGLFSQAAEEALGEAGLWGLAVPEAFGGTGCSLQELAAAITRIAARVPTAAGLLSVHSSIGAVSAVTAFGTPEQQSRHLPGLARGMPLSIFGGTEPEAGCDLGAAAARIETIEGRLTLSGTKMFITGATYGRLVKVLAKREGRACVVLVRLPKTDSAGFRLVGYPLHPLKHAHNNALEFDRFPIDERDVLTMPPHAAGGSPSDAVKPDAMKIVWHGLNRGRVTLAAQAAGTLRILLDQAARFALQRQTWGAPIGSRELVQGRLGRLAASILACDSLAAWAAAAIDAGQTGELEAIAAKVVASECVRSGAIDALGVHGGRAFLVGHALGDSFHDHFAVTIYEGESDLLGLALFKGLVKHHPAIGGSRHRAALDWLAWRVGRLAAAAAPDGRSILDRTLRAHARRARRLLARSALGIDRLVRTHGRRLADRQLLVGRSAAAVRDLVSVLAVAHRGDMLGDEKSLLAADCWCRMVLARATGRPPTAADDERLAALGRATLPR
jgi:long-subunit acyl-CoA synthetase (AMP-forming)/alkylation response protein AidB-like acyl-CoA dehydrogenase